jgi:hypothetical protein
VVLNLKPTRKVALIPIKRPNRLSFEAELPPRSTDKDLMVVNFQGGKRPSDVESANSDTASIARTRHSQTPNVWALSCRPADRVARSAEFDAK